MIEFPEAITLANQMSDAFVGQVITEAEANSSPHKFAFYSGDPLTYNDRLSGRMVDEVQATGPYIEILLSDGMSLLLREGTNPRLLTPDAPLPKKHQLLLRFNNELRLVCTITMYGLFHLADTSSTDDELYQAAAACPSPLSCEFDRSYFASLISSASPKLSAKAFLATEQRMPGVGNGVLQDILFNAGINPKTKLANLNDEAFDVLFDALKTTLATMTEQGGRNTERDLYGNEGGYPTLLSAKTYKEPCPRCHNALVKQAYMGGSIYFCPTCQPLP